MCVLRHRDPLDRVPRDASIRKRPCVSSTGGGGMGAFPYRLRVFVCGWVGVHTRWVQVGGWACVIWRKSS